ncbi:MAG: hypothetical protein WA702_10200 [Bradyrhizobium sp.]|uniref:hypothetical protein n=1 Tax=Bradyrhizobium sp. TaxID=376 RepID=UPI003C7ECE26
MNLDLAVMSGRISIGFVDFPAFLSDFDRVRIFSFTSFLVRNWCGCASVSFAVDIVSSAAPEQSNVRLIS